MTGKRPADVIPALLGPELARAACRGKSPLFDAAVHGETVAGRNTRYQRATAICARCPVTDWCLEHRNGDAGIWGGELFRGNGQAARKCACGAFLPEHALPYQKYCTERCGETHRKLRNQPKAVLDTVTCAQIGCTATFTKRMHNHRFCSEQCQNQHWNTHRPKPPKRTTLDTWTQLGPGYCHRYGCVTPLDHTRRDRGSPWCSENCRRAGTRRLARERQEAA
jgi:hypothetical protein